MATPQELVTLAYTNIDTKYHPFITLLKGKPYVTVAGRVAMAIDEHKKAGKTLSIETRFETVFDRPVVYAFVKSGLYGTFQGSDDVFLGATSGANAASPIACAETSAIGRALGFMGYGLITGIASYDEVETAMANDVEPQVKPHMDSLKEVAKEGLPGRKREAELGYAKKVAEVTDLMALNPVVFYEPPVEAVDPNDWNTKGNFADQARAKASTHAQKGATEPQLKYVCSLLAQNGVAEGNAHALVERIYPGGMTSREASEAIETLKKNPKESKLLAAYAAHPVVTTEQWHDMIEHISEATGHDYDYVSGWIDKSFKKRDDVSFRAIQAMNSDDIAKDVSLFIAQKEKLREDLELEDLPF